MSWNLWRFGLLLLGSCVLSPLFTVSSLAIDSDGGGKGEGGKIEWEILTKHNFSSQVRLHSYALLMVTVPWSGESRSLMKELAHEVSRKQHKFGSLRLMLLYRNNEKMLADAIGASGGITILYYRHSVPYTYKGRLRAQNILSSAQYFISLLPEEFPFKPLGTPHDMERLIESTDKAVILFEFCGWTPKLLAKANNNVTEDTSGVLGGLFGTDFNEESNRTLTLKEKKNQKGMENENMVCGVNNEFSGNWLGELSSVNKTSDVLSCTLGEFHNFESFFSKFMAATREFYLPPERQRFGLVSEPSLLSSMGIENSGSWLAMLNFLGCPSCSKILKEGDDLKYAFQMQNSVVVEVEGDGHELQPALPANRPSVLLFVDRSSESSKIRRKSKEALDLFRKFVLYNQISYQLVGQDNDKPDKSSAHANEMSMGEHGNHQLNPFLQTQNTILKDKTSITVVNEGGHVALDNIVSDLQGSSLGEILAYILQQQKETKFSSVAKQAGFQLLSDDFDIKIADMSPSETENLHSSQISPEQPLERLADSASDELPTSTSVMRQREQFTPTYIKDTSPDDKEKEASVDKPAEVMPVEAGPYHTNDGLAIAEDVKAEQSRLPKVDNFGEQQHLHQAFKGSFFFSDGGYQLLKALTSTTEVPSAVIIDPSSQHHYVFPGHRVFTYSSLVEFINGFLNDSIFPYQHSESFVLSPKEGAHPPFVNLDFHEVDGIPRVTTGTFSEMVLGSNQSDSSNSGDVWKKDVLVLFSNSWCGFCQRMEAVVREVHRASMGYSNMLKRASVEGEFALKGGKLGEVVLKLPLIYLMDCTLNDCSWILKSVNQRDVYPSLLLFPAVRKNAVSYEGVMETTSIMKFIADHGSDSHLIIDEGLLLTEAEKQGSYQNFYKKAPPTIHEDALIAKDVFQGHEVILQGRGRKVTARYAKRISSISKGLHETAPPVIVGSILLATDRLLDVQLFEESRILIVKANQSTGFQGLIINRHINWDSLEGLVEGLELLKEAPVSLGGPLIRKGMPLVSLTYSEGKHHYLEVLPNVYFLDQEETLNEINRLKSGNHSFTDYWFFFGYASWNWGQLFDEISEGAWNVSSDKLRHFEWP